MPKTLAYMLHLQPPGWLSGPHLPSWDAIVLGLIFGTNIFQGSLVPTTPFYYDRFSCHGRDTIAVLRSCQTLQLNCWISPQIQGTWAVISVQLVHFLNPLCGKDYACWRFDAAG